MSKRERDGEGVVNDISAGSLFSGGMYVIYVMDVMMDVLFFGRVDEHSFVFVDAVNGRVIITYDNDWFGQRPYVRFMPVFADFLEMMPDSCNVVYSLSSGDVTHLCNLYRLRLIDKRVGLPKKRRTF